jgi:hypothetical protein
MEANEQSGQAAPARQRGYLDPGSVTGFVFYVVTACIAAGVVVSILAVWALIGDLTLWRALATCLIVALGAVFFAVVNLCFTARSDKGGGGCRLRFPLRRSKREEADSGAGSAGTGSEHTEA